MKKIIAALLCAILALSLCACGAKPVPTEADTTEPDAVTDVDTGDEEEAEVREQDRGGVHEDRVGQRRAG